MIPSEYAEMIVIEESAPPPPPPLGACQDPSPRRNVVALGVPLALIFATVTTELSMVQVAPDPETVMSPLSPSLTPPPPPEGVVQVLSPRRNVVLSAVPDPSRAVAMIPLVMSDAA
jgi:hypothetical protein